LAFLRFTRDTRGYEHFYLVQQTTNRRGKMRPRLLYWFRTPPNVKVGRQPFDEAVRRALEAQNPDIHFDWQAIVDTPIPPPVETERWREKRRFERAARQAAVEETREAVSDTVAAAEPRDPPSPLRGFGEAGPPSLPEGFGEAGSPSLPEGFGELVAGGRETRYEPRRRCRAVASRTARLGPAETAAARGRRSRPPVVVLSRPIRSARFRRSRRSKTSSSSDPEE
jgi:hypothetical protein